MNLGKDIEHGGYPTSETRTISQMRRDADAYAGIGIRSRKAIQQHRAENALRQRANPEGLRQKANPDHETKKVVDTIGVDGVRCTQPQDEATEILGATKMILTRSGYSKNGKAAFYGGAGSQIRLNLSQFVGKQAPEMIEVTDGVFAPAKEPKVKMTKEERKAANAAKPKPTEAERIARAEAALAKRKAKLAEAEQPSL